MTDETTTDSRSDRVRYYWTLTVGTVGRILDVALMVLGSLLLGLAAALTLAVFGAINRTVEVSTPAGLASALVLGVLGAFCFGLAGEGPLGRGRRLTGFRLFEMGIGRTIASFLIGLVGYWGYDTLSRLAEDMPEPIFQGLEGLRAVSVAGLTVMPLIGIPLSLVARYFSEKYPIMGKLEVPVMFITWAVATMIIFN